MDENLMKLYDSSIHFPSTQPVNSLLCATCHQNQQKIIHVLSAFDGTSKQYAEHVKRIEAKYPLCATCNYRVSQKLQQCQEEALHYQRQHAFSSGLGSDWRSKIRLAQQMKWKQLRRKLLRVSFFLPELLFQSFLVASVFVGPVGDHHHPFSKKVSLLLADGKELSFWLPEVGTAFSFASWIPVIAAVLMLWQIVGAGCNGHGMSNVIVQAVAFALRMFVANFLFNSQSFGVSKVSAAIFASAGLAIVVGTGGQNGRARAQRSKKLEIIRSRSLDRNVPSHELNFESSSLLLNPATGSAASSAGGFARFAAEEHKYHSFANQVSGEVKPWPVRPKPGNFKVQPKSPDFVSLAAMNENASSGVKMRPSRLVVEDPLEVEHMFSSFSLSDSPALGRQQPITSNSPRNPIVKASLMSNSKPLASVRQPSASSAIDKSRLWFAFYHSVLTLTLLACRAMVGSHLSSVAVVLAAAFGLRGFVWPRLSGVQQAATLSFALLRLLYLACELHSCVPYRVSPHLQLIFDVFLIMIR